jgi:peptide/nickel transport system permease protein
MQRKSAVAGFFLLLLIIPCIVFAPQFAPYKAGERAGAAFESPSTSHLLGTNDIGVDVFSELFYAGRVSLIVGFIASFFIVVTGSSIGILSGYSGGIIDEILMRFTDIVLILPRFPLMIVMAAYLGPGMWTIIFAYSVVGWPSLARQVRSQVLAIRKVSFIEASRAMGGSSFYIMRTHILPNISGIIVANGIMEIMFAILTEAGLSFLGLGDPTNQSWGVMLYFAQIQGAFLRGAWWWIFPPGICIALISCSINFIGTAMNDLFSLKLSRINKA